MATVRKTAGTPEKDPSGGLTAAGRAAFAAKDGSHLKPGVTKSDAEMSLEDMKRKGSWAVRFYGRDPLPPLLDAKGEPTRFALSAHAWGEPVPKTEAAARKIAAKGKKLLERYEASKPAAGAGKTSVAAKTVSVKKTVSTKKAAPAKKTAPVKTAAPRKAAASKRAMATKKTTVRKTGRVASPDS